MERKFGPASGPESLIAPDPEFWLRTDHLRKDLKSRTVRGGAATTLSQAAKFGLTFVSTAVLARLLSPQDYGLIAMVTVVTGFVSIFTQLGLSTATIQRPSITQGQISALFWINLLAGSIAFSFTAALSPAIAWFYAEPRLTWVTVVLASGFIVAGAGTQHMALLARQMAFGTLAAIDVLSLLAGVLSGILAAWLGAGYMSLVLLHVVTLICTTIGAWVACNWRPTKRSSMQEVRSLLAFGGNLTGFNFLSYLGRNADSVLIGRFIGSYELGLYSRAYGLLLLPLQQINTPIAAVAVPALSRIAEAPEHLRAAYKRILSKICLVTMPFGAFMIGTADWIVAVVLGSNWMGASEIFAWLGILALIQPVSNTTGWLFIAEGRSRDQLHWGVIGGLLTVSSFVIGLPWGVTGVAASYALSGLAIRTPLLFWLVGRKGAVRTSDYYATAAPSLVASLACLVAVLVLRRAVPLTPIPGLVVAFCVTCLVSLAVTAAIPAGRQTLQDLKGLVGMLPLKRVFQFGR
ncbi:MAG: lipopolysaccharide biosynthesis protein [Bryobacteraceae bacterium]